MRYVWHFSLVPTAPSPLWKTKKYLHTWSNIPGGRRRGGKIISSFPPPPRPRPLPQPTIEISALEKKKSTTFLSMFHNRLQTETSPGKLLNLESLISPSPLTILQIPAKWTACFPLQVQQDSAAPGFHSHGAPPRMSALACLHAHRQKTVLPHSFPNKVCPTLTIGTRKASKLQVSRNRTAKASDPSAEKSNLQLFSLTFSYFLYLWNYNLGDRNHTGHHFPNCFFHKLSWQMLTDILKHMMLK